MANSVEDIESSKPQLSLRERKCARTKHALLQAAIERLREKHLDEITVKELCEDVEVCEATFFNYFRKKTDLLHYFVRIWTLEVLYHAREQAGPNAGLRFIEAIFEHTGNRLAGHPRLMLELIAHMAFEPHATCPEHSPELSTAERLEALGRCTMDEVPPELGLPNLFRPALDRAVELGELPADIDREAAVLGLLSVFFGVPLWLGPQAAAQISSGYQQQLRLLWSGLGAAYEAG